MIVAKRTGFFLEENGKFTMCEMDKIAWQKPFSSVSDFAIKKSKKIHIFLI